jgi:TP901 family phage tail tape measure protein
MKAFEVFVTFAAIDHLTGPMRKMSAEMGLLGRQSEELEKKLAKFKTVAMVGGAITAAGGVMAKGLYTAVEAAGELQMSLLAVKQNLALTARQFEQLQNMVMTEGIPTAFSAAQMGQLAQGLVSGGMGNLVTGALDPNSQARKLFREYTAYADVRYLGHSHEAPMESVSTASQMAHAYGVYDVAGTRRFLNSLNSALASYHGTSSQFQTQFGYYAGTAKRLGMPMEQAIQSEAYLGRVGLGGNRGGTALNQFLQKLLPNGHSMHDAALKEAGFVDANGRSIFMNGNTFVGMEKAMALLQKFHERTADVVAENRLLSQVFGEQGKRVADKMMDKGAVELWHRTGQDMAKVASITKQQKEYFESWEGQVKAFTSTIHDLWIQLGMKLLPYAIEVVKYLGEMAAKALEFAQENPDIVRLIGTFATLATAVALVVGPLMVMIGGLGWLATSGVIATGVGLVGTALTSALPIIAAVGVAVALLREAWVRNWFGIQQKVGAVIEWFKANAPYIGEAFIESIKQVQTYWGYAMDTLEASAKQVKGWWDLVTSGILTTFNAIKDAATWVKTNVTWAVSGPNGGSIFPQMPVGMSAHAMGTNFAAGGLALVGERGPELVNLPRGSKVIPNNQIGGGGVHVDNLIINQQPGQSPRELAHEVMRQIAVLGRNRSYGSPDSVLSMW